MNRSALLAAALLALAAAFTAAQTAQKEAPAPAAIPDRDLGLSKTSVSDVPSPPPVADNETAPGEEPALPRAYPGAPPRIPHGIASLLPITRTDNFCIDCHLIDEKVEGGPTPIPTSHKIDLRNAPGKVGEGVVGARWFCVSCHVPVTGAPPLVGNSFTATPPQPATP